MRTEFSLIVISILSLINSTASTYAAPLPRGIAVNSNTKECAGYWGGDEFVHYKLPGGWKTYYPNYQNTPISISTPHGNCYNINPKECCAEIGYEYISENIGRREMTMLGLQQQMNLILESPFSIVLVGVFCLVILGVTIFLFRFRRKDRK